MSLESGRKLNWNHWTELPMPKDVIDRVHVLARRSKASKSLLLPDRNGINTPGEAVEGDQSDDDDDEDYFPVEDSEADTDNEDVENYMPEDNLCTRWRGESG
jgi:hypothetical protein